MASTTHSFGNLGGQHWGCVIGLAKESKCFRRWVVVFARRNGVALMFGLKPKMHGPSLTAEGSWELGWDFVGRSTDNGSASNPGQQRASLFHCE